MSGNETVAEECGASEAAAAGLQQNLIIALTASNMALLILVGLIVRRLEGLNAKLTRFMKSSRVQKSASLTQMGSGVPSSGSLAPVAKDPPSRPASPDVARELVVGHVHMLQKTLSTESLRSSLSADDFASLQCMLGDEDGVTM
mmetsp:Transcript_6544/g.20432  ORF Transcript_6544/g.20432 Transcript_6544/m.20432 type:complete len:144 (+) Transcript_6544:87-518(+)